MTVSNFGIVQSKPTGGGGYDAAAIALFARMTPTPSTPRKTTINNLIVSLKGYGIWTKLDLLYLFAADFQANAVLNWTGATNPLGINGGISFTSDQGFTGNGSTGYLDTNSYGLSTGQFTQDDHAAGIWTRTVGTGGSYLFGLLDSAPSAFFADEWNGGGNTGFSDAPSGVQDPFSYNAALHTAISRASHTQFKAYGNGTLLGSPNRILGASTLTPFFILAINNVGSASGFGNHQVSAFHAGASLDATDIGNLNTSLTTYMTDVGAYP